MTEYLLSNHVYLRLTGEGAILLDLRRDEYINLSHDQVATLRGTLVGWPDLSSRPDEKRTAKRNDDASEFIATLLQRGLVTTNRVGGKLAIQEEIEPAETSLVEHALSAPARRPACLIHFIAAFLRTSLDMRLKPLHRVVSSVERRKRANSPESRLSSSPELHALVDNFVFYRPFLYTQKEKCLFDSLLLVNFLATYRIFPTLVFGVRTRPFEAHAWVQSGRCALNYSSAYVRSFLPIMAI